MLELMLGGTPKRSIRIKKANVNRDVTVALTESGRLYCRGNVGIMRGVDASETFVNNWALIDSEVEDYFTPNLQGLVYRRTDKTWWGSGYVLGLGNNSLTYRTKTNITSWFQMIPSDVGITKIVTGNANTHILLDNGDVYNAGNGTNGALGMRSSASDIRMFDKLWVGTGPTGSATGFPMGTKFRDIACGLMNSTTYLIGTDNSIYALGTAGGYAMGTNNTRPQNLTAVGLGSGAFTQIHAGVNCYYYVTQDRSVSAIGSYYYGQVGGGKYYSDHASGSGVPYPIVTTPVGVKARVFTAAGRVWAESDGQWWYTGAEGYGVGSSTGLTRGVPVNITAGMGGDFSGAVISSLDIYFTNTVAVKDGVLYGCGYNNGYANNLAPIKKDAGSYVFVPLDLTGIDA